VAVVIPIIADVKGLARGVDDTEKTLGRLGKNVGKLGANLTKSVTLPIIGLGVASLAAFNEVDKGLDAVAVGTGATGDALKGLQQTFKNVAANATQGMEEVGNVVAEVNTRLGLTGEPLEEFSDRMLTLSRITGIDAVAATKSVTRAMNDAGVAVEDAGSFMDVLLVASQQTGIGVDELADKMVKFGSPMRQLGFSVEETAALLGGFEKAGVNTDLVMGSLRIGLGKLAKAGEKDLPKALRESIKAIKNAETGGEAAAMAMELFGSRAGADMAAAIREGRLDVDDLVTTLENADGALQSTAEATEGPQEQLKKMKNQLTLTGAAFAEIFIPVLERALGPLQRMLTVFREMSPTQKNVVVTTLAIAAAVGPLLIIISKAISVFLMLRSAIIAVRAAQIGLNLAMIANPIGLIVVAIAALVAGLIIAYKRSETFRNIVDAIGATVRDSLIKAFEWLRTKISEIWPVVQQMYDRAKPILDLIGKAVETGVSVYVLAVGTYIRAWITVLQTAYNLIRPVAILIGDLVKDYIVANVKAIKTGIDAAVTAFNAIKGAVTSVRDAIDKPIDRIDSMIRDGIGGAAEYVKGAIRGITGVFQTVVTGIREFWNKNVGGKGFSVPGWVPGFGGNSFKIPFLAEGGIVRSPTLAMIGEGGPEAVIPLSKMGQGGNTINVVVNAGLGTNPDELSRVIVDSIKRYERRNGQVFQSPLAPRTATASGVTSTASGAGDFTTLVAARRG
jgi:TP901 family phage tail tape measure protein